jgi:SpoIID/LytB domain protein
MVRTLMLTEEPKIKVALLQNRREAYINLNGKFTLTNGTTISGKITAHCSAGSVYLDNFSGIQLHKQKEIFLFAQNAATFTVPDIKIGIDFHWQQSQQQTFCGDILLSTAKNSSLNLINIVPLEEYLASVISSEMSAEAPLEFLKAQAVIARSWLVAMLAKKKTVKPLPELKSKNEIVVWKDVNDHEGFDVCADDHCQRYQGITRIASANVEAAIKDTRGLFLVCGKEICDARYYKCCGGITDIFSSAWEDKTFSYLQSVTDHSEKHIPIQSEKDVKSWLQSRPPAYCNTTDKKILTKIMTSFDQETLDFYRWRIIYKRRELEEIIRKKTGMDLGRLENLIPIARGPSGRIYKLKIEGSKKTVLVGKELEIRRWLSPTHLLSSAFVVSTKRGADGSVSRFILDGGGWGHGVGLCQIGAAVMANKGFKAEDILAHYFTGVALQKLY